MPLMEVVWLGQPDNVLERMINKGECRTRGRRTIVHHLAWFACLPALRNALRKTNKVNRRNKCGRTPLHSLAAELRSYEEHRETAVSLLEHNASKTLKDNDGKTPLD